MTEKQNYPVVNRLNLPAGPSGEIRIHSSPTPRSGCRPMRIVINFRVIDEPTLAGSASVGAAGLLSIKRLARRMLAVRSHS